MKEVKFYSHVAMIIVGVFSALWHGISIFAFVLFLGSRANAPGSLLSFWRNVMINAPIVFVLSFIVAIYALVWFSHKTESYTPQ